MKNKLNLFLLLFIFAAGLIVAQTSSPTNLTGSVENWGMRKYVKLTWNHELQSHNVKFEIYKKLSDSTEFEKVNCFCPRNEYHDFFVELGKTYNYYIVAVAGGVASLPTETITVTIEEPVVISGSISGVITDDVTGLPILGAQVQLIPKQHTFPFVTRLFTDSIGTFTADVPEGEYYIFVCKPMYKFEYFENAAKLRDATPVTVTSQNAVSVGIGLAPFVIPQVFTLKGKVTDNAGTGIHARLKIILQNTLHNNVRYAVTNQDGDYSVRLKENDTVIVYAETFNSSLLPEYYDNKLTAQEADVLVVNQNLENINFVLEPRPAYVNTITGMLTDTLGLPIVGSVSAFKLAEGTFNLFKVSTVSDSTGAYALTNLIPGKYILFACSFPNYIPTFFRYDGVQTLHRRDADTLVIAEDTNLSGVSFTLLGRMLGGNGSIVGNINDEEGNPLNGSVIFVKNNDGNVISASVSNSAGNFTVPNLSANTYSLVISRFDYDEAELNNVEVSENSYYSPIVNVTLTPSSLTDVQSETVTPEGFALSQNFPNPFNPETSIKFSIPSTNLVTIKIYDILGNEVAVLVNETKQTGNYELKFNAANLSSGVYFYSIQAGSYTKTLKMALLK
ncbi:MAG: carboxypeptidase regulatory-like domain-containing protein [bacterium]